MQPNYSTAVSNKKLIISEGKTKSALTIEKDKHRLQYYGTHSGELESYMLKDISQYEINDTVLYIARQTYDVSD